MTWYLKVPWLPPARIVPIEAGGWMGSLPLNREPVIPPRPASQRFQANHASRSLRFDIILSVGLPNSFQSGTVDGFRACGVGAAWMVHCGRSAKHRGDHGG